MSLTNKSIKFALLAGGLAAAGAFTSLAGPEPLQASSKDKEIQEIAPACNPRWYISIGGDAEVNFGGNDFARGESRTFSVPRIATVDVDIASQDYNEVYDNPFYSIEGEFGYVLTRHIELFGTFRYSASAGTELATGSRVFVDVPNVFTGNFPFSTSFGNYRSYGGEVGLRYFFLSSEKRFRPYISLSGGVSHVDSIGFETHADVSSVGGPADITLLRGTFYNDSWVGTGSALFGLEYRVTCHWTFGVNAGVHYVSQLDPNDGALNRIANAGGGMGGPFDLSFVNKVNDNAGDRWTVPVTGYVKFRF